MRCSIPFALTFLLPTILHKWEKPALRLLYHQEMGRIHARYYRKRFSEVGISQGWFAVLEGLIVASGGSKEEAEQAAKRIVPSEKRSWVHYFQLGRK